jgi:hypothetical protein
MRDMNHYASAAGECKDPVGAFAGLDEVGPEDGSRLRDEGRTKYYPNRSSFFK